MKGELLRDLGRLGWPTLICLLLSSLLAKPIFNLLVKLKSRQNVSEFAPESHQVKQGTPTMGGIIVLVGLLTGCLLVQTRFSLVCASPVVLFGAIGFADDFVIPRLMPGTRGLGWKEKLAMQVVACLVPALIYTSGKFVPEIGLMIVVVLFFSNAYNFADGLDGLAGGLAILIAGGYVGLALVSGQTQFGPLSVCLFLAASVVPFLFLNAPPAKLFMGDVGALPIGALLGWINIELMRSDLGTEISRTLPLCLLGLVLVAELVPVPLQILSVKLRKGKRLFPRTPIHHAFEHAGWPESRVTWTFLLVQFICTLFAVLLAASSQIAQVSLAR